MTKYEELMNKSALYEQKADAETDMLVKTYYAHVADGYKTRAARLSVEEAQQPATAEHAI